MKRVITFVLPLAAVLALGAIAQTNAPDTPAVPAPPPVLKERPATPPRAPRPPRGPVVVHTGGPYLGVVARDITPELMSALKLKEDRGVEVIAVDTDSPAAKAGIKDHDVLVSFNGQNIEGYEQLARMIRETPAGHSVKLGLIRDGKPLTLTANIARRHRDFAAIETMQIHVPDFSGMEIPSFAMVQVSARSGMAVEDLTPQLAEFFGVKGGGGVLVRSVDRGSPAEAAGLKAGDVVTKVGNEHVANTNDWRRALRTSAGTTVNVNVVRDRHEQTISLKLPEQKTGAMRNFDWQSREFQKSAADLNAELKDLGPEIAAEMAKLAESQRKWAEEFKRAVEEQQRYWRDKD